MFFAAHKGGRVERGSRTYGFDFSKFLGIKFGLARWLKPASRTTDNLPSPIKRPRSREKRNDAGAAYLTIALFGLVFQAIDQIHFLLFGYAALSG